MKREGKKKFFLMLSKTNFYARWGKHSLVLYSDEQKIFACVFFMFFFLFLQNSSPEAQYRLRCVLSAGGVGGGGSGMITAQSVSLNAAAAPGGSSATAQDQPGQKQQKQMDTMAKKVRPGSLLLLYHPMISYVHMLRLSIL